MCIYHKDHLSGLRMKNTSESDLHSYEVTYINKAQKDQRDSNPWKQAKCEFNLYPLYEENEMMCIS